MKLLFTPPEFSGSDRGNGIDDRFALVCGQPEHEAPVHQVRQVPGKFMTNTEDYFSGENTSVYIDRLCQYRIGFGEIQNQGCATAIDTE